MAESGMTLARVEGGAWLFRDDAGYIRLSAPRSGHVEPLLHGRAPREAITLTQHISAASCVTHAIAAAEAWEAAADISVAPNGAILRDLMHALSLLHAHLHQFYFTVLPDYLPPSAFAGYDGSSPVLLRQARAWAAKAEGSWARFAFVHRFKQKEAERLAEHQHLALEAMAILQKLMAMVGGKFPVVMSIVPGGVAVNVEEPLLVRLRAHLREVAWFLREGPFADGLNLVERYRDTVVLGQGKDALISGGTVGDVSGPGGSLYARGVLLGRSLESFQPQVSESIGSAFYRIALQSRGRFRPLTPAPGKPGAYTWIKAPRYVDRAMETGALARLAITHLAGTRDHTHPVVEEVQRAMARPITACNTVAGRLLALVGEVAPLTERCEALLNQLVPGQPSVLHPEHGDRPGGEGVAHLDAPAGMVQHRVVAERGRVVHYDIISPSTWNGTPEDENGEGGGVEFALNGVPPDLTTLQGQLTASRIVHSYFFSATDAVQ